MQIVLIGMMFSGKTTVGENLSKYLNTLHFDSDKIIENHYGAISTIFKEFDESYFRDLEEKVIEDILNKNCNCILSTGGGAILREKTRHKLKSSIVIFLQTSLEELQKRAAIETLRHHNLDTQRPLLQKLEKLYYERENLYYATANFIVHTDNKNVIDVAKEIKKMIEGVV